MGNYDPRRRGGMVWQGTLAEMRQFGAHVVRMCGGGCPFRETVELDSLIHLLGPGAKLWDERPPCPRCDRRNHFMSAPSKGQVLRPMLSWDRGPEPKRPPGGWPPWPWVAHSPAMATYTLIVTGEPDGHQHTTLVDFEDDASIVAGAKEALTAQHTSITIARGSGDNLQFIGSWDRLADGSLCWTEAE